MIPGLGLEGAGAVGGAIPSMASGPAVSGNGEFRGGSASVGVSPQGGGFNTAPVFNIVGGSGSSSGGSSAAGGFSLPWWGWLIVAAAGIGALFIIKRS